MKIALGALDLAELAAVVHFFVWDPESNRYYAETGYRGHLPNIRAFLKRAFSPKGYFPNPAERGFFIPRSTLAVFPEIADYFQLWSIPLQSPAGVFRGATSALQRWEKRFMWSLDQDLPFLDAVPLVSPLTGDLCPPKKAPMTPPIPTPAIDQLIKKLKAEKFDFTHSLPPPLVEVSITTQQIAALVSLVKQARALHGAIGGTSTSFLPKGTIDAPPKDAPLPTCSPVCFYYEVTLEGKTVHQLVAIVSWNEAHTPGQRGAGPTHANGREGKDLVEDYGYPTSPSPQPKPKSNYEK
ncbi:hypothetical protein [Verrucomicrobium sp. GAS474]|uniref:hypothetical protein n=1 Tax=Verrucomicrobium sp. GAS474 TaxID=1882831 RepID=UPI0012FF7E98|nr:hypothetical protein [Verrucomicrobium sp. GAS474]